MSVKRLTYLILKQLIRLSFGLSCPPLVSPLITVFIKMYFNYFLLFVSFPLDNRFLGVKDFNLLIFAPQGHNKVSVQYPFVERIKG